MASWFETHGVAALFTMRILDLILRRREAPSRRMEPRADALEIGMPRTILAAFVALLTFAGNAFADKFPSHPITIVVPFSAGGPSDAMTRILADRMKTSLGEAILVENTTGAGGSIGVGRV